MRPIQHHGYVAMHETTCTCLHNINFTGESCFRGNSTIRTYIAYVIAASSQVCI